MIRVAIADDHPEMRVALRLLLSLSKDIELVCEATNGQDALECVKHQLPDLLVMDIYMPVLNGLAAAKQIAGLSLPTRMILISAHVGTFIVGQAKLAGAHGFIPKDNVAASLLPAIEAVHRGDTFFVQ